LCDWSQSRWAAQDALVQSVGTGGDNLVGGDGFGWCGRNPQEGLLLVLQETLWYNNNLWSFVRLHLDDFSGFCLKICSDFTFTHASKQNFSSLF